VWAPPLLSPTEGRNSRRGTIGPLIGAGLAIGALLVGVILLYVNTPPGYDVPHGLSVESIGLFRSLWSYPTFAVDAGPFSLLAAVAILLLWGMYFGACALVWRSRATFGRRQIAITITTFAVVYHVLLTLFMPPVLSSDIYHYALFGRMVAFYDLNPYIVPGGALSSDPVWQFVGWRWRDVTSHYGPAWTMISAAAALTSGQSVLTTALAFKAIAALFNLANCLLVLLLARRLGGGDGVGALLLYAWNPLILIETAGSGHNDGAMMTFALLGLLLASTGKLLLGLAALMLSVMVKYLTGLLLLFFVVRCLAKAASLRHAALLGARMAAVAIPLTFAFFLPFWVGPETLERLTTVGSPFKTGVRVVLRDSLAGVLASGADFEQARAAVEPYVILGLHLAFGALVLLLAKAILADRRGWPGVLESWAVASLVYMALVYGWNFPWFLISALATTCLVLKTRMSLRLLALSHGLSIVWMLPYALLLEV
jgi:hypothetical protein